MFLSSVNASAAIRQLNITYLIVFLALSVNLHAPGARAESGRIIEEIIVTAQKREQNQQNVPVSLIAHSGEALDKARITELVDLSDISAGLSAESIGLRSPFIFMRGTGSGSFDIGSDSSVSVFVDELYIPRFTGMQLGLNDVEQVEVLKGPQGTLFGRNTLGGAISITSKKPTEEFSGNIGLDIGNKDYISVRASIEGALSQNVLGRLSLSGNVRDGWVENTVSGVDHLDSDSKGIKGQLLFTGDKLDALFSLSYTRDDANAVAFQNTTSNVFLLFPPTLTAPLSLSDDPENQAYDTDGYQDREGFIFSAKFDWDLSFATLTSITGFIHHKFEELHDLDATSAFVANRFADEESDTISQEVRLTSNNEGNLRWLAGLYYYHDDAERQEITTLGTNSAVAVFFNAGAAYTLQDDVTVDTTSWAVFGQIDYDFLERWTLSLGMRYSDDSKDHTRTAVPGAPSPLLPVTYSVTEEPSWDDFSPKVALQFRPTDDISLYASYGEGFKSGGFQPTVPATTIAASNVFNPEQVESWEIGAKTKLFDERLRLNLTAFHVDYDDLQFLAATDTGIAGFIVVTTNAAKSSTDGVELDFEALLTDNLSATGSYAYLDATFDDYIDGTGVDQSGNRIIRTPEHQGNLALTYSVPLATGVVNLSGSVRAQTRTYFSPDNIDATSQPGYAQFGARLEYIDDDGDWSVALWGKNLGNKAVCGNVIALVANTVGLCSIDSLRAYGASFNYSF